MLAFRLQADEEDLARLVGGEGETEVRFRQPRVELARAHEIEPGLGGGLGGVYVHQVSTAPPSSAAIPTGVLSSDFSSGASVTASLSDFFFVFFATLSLPLLRTPEQ